jgi:ribose 5-phosphate isomerase B
MKVALAADHAGYALKQRLVAELRRRGHEPIDLGAASAEPSDYPDFARAVAEAVLSGAAPRAVLVCGSGAGACVAANKFKGVRAATCHDIFSAHQCVEDDDCNVLCLGARVVGEEPAVEIVERYLSSTFSGAERHRRRLAKVAAFEEQFGK